MKKRINFLLLGFCCNILFGQISLSALQKAVNANPTQIPILLKGYNKEHTSSGIDFYGNSNDENTIAIEHKQDSNIVSYAFDNKIIFKQFEKEIDKISLQNGCDVVENVDTEMDTPLEVKFECGGYFYYVKTLNYNNIVAGYSFSFNNYLTSITIKGSKKL